MEVSWEKRKPMKFIEDCLLLTASWVGGNANYWDYSLFEIKKTDGYNDNDEPCWYWGIFLDGDEWGDYDDLVADKYCIINQLKKRGKQ